jgi:hypothetical protein
MPEKTNSLTGVAGEHYVCAELAKQGYIALMTPKNNPLFDVVATNQEGARSVSIQIKTRAADNRQGWKLGKDMEKKHRNPDLFVILVQLKDADAPDFYIYEHDVLSERIAAEYQKYLAKPNRNGQKRKDVDFRWFDEIHFGPEDKARKNAWRIITDKLK